MSTTPATEVPTEEPRADVPKVRQCFDVKQHFTANGPVKEFARDVRAQIRGVMDPLSGPARQVMAGDRSASSRPDHLF